MGLQRGLEPRSLGVPARIVLVVVPRRDLPAQLTGVLLNRRPLDVGGDVAFAGASANPTDADIPVKP